MRIVYLGSPAPAVLPLSYLLKNLPTDFELVAVVSQPARPTGRDRHQNLVDPAVAQFAKSNNILCLQPIKASDPDFLESFQKLEPDIAITCAYGQILTESFLSIPKRATINIHPSALPQYRGATPVPATILGGEKQTAVTILFTIRQLDAGNIIIQQESDVLADETADKMTNRLFTESGPLLIKALEKLQDKDFKGYPQDEALATFCKKIRKEDGLIDWRQSANQIFRQFRAYFPWPGTYCFLKDRRIVIESMRAVNSSTFTKEKINPGELYLSQQELLVGCGQGTLVAIDQLKPAGSKSVSGLAFWNGLKDRKQFEVWDGNL